MESGHCKLYDWESRNDSSPSLVLRRKMQKACFISVSTTPVSIFSVCQPQTLIRNLKGSVSLRVNKDGCTHRSNNFLDFLSFLPHSPAALCSKLITAFKGCIAEEDCQEFATFFFFFFTCCAAQTTSWSSRKLFYFSNGLQNLRFEKEALSLQWVFLTDRVWKNNNQNSQILHCVGMLGWQVQQQSYTSYSTRLLSRTFFTCLWKGPFWSLAKSRLAAHHPGMITRSDEKTQEDDTGVMGWKSACRGAKHIS